MSMRFAVRLFALMMVFSVLIAETQAIHTEGPNHHKRNVARNLQQQDDPQATNDNFAADNQDQAPPEEQAPQAASQEASATAPADQGNADTPSQPVAAEVSADKLVLGTGSDESSPLPSQPSSSSSTNEQSQNADSETSSAPSFSAQPFVIQRPDLPATSTDTQTADSNGQVQQIDGENDPAPKQPNA